MPETPKGVLENWRLVCDGAMDTQLMLAGLEWSGCGESWNLVQPEHVQAIRRRYVEAGVDCLITNVAGSCCGNTPDHTQAIRQVMDEFNRNPKPRP